MAIKADSQFRSDRSVLIIAEVGSVHDGSFGNACKIIALASDAGANAVKFQTHIAAAETTRNAPEPPYFKGEPRYEYFERTGFSKKQWIELKQHAESCGVEFLSSPFSEAAVDLLESVGVTRYKIPSGEVTNTSLLDRVAITGKPVLLSSGMSDWSELDLAVEALRAGGGEVTVMQCTSAYPCADTQVGLNVIGEMLERWGLPVGFSDHTLDNHAAFAAVAFGATVVEKHLTFSRAMYGSDAAHACEPGQFRELVRGIRAVSTMLANPVDKSDVSDVAEMKQIFQKSVVAAVPIRAGSVIERDMVAAKKPGTGIPARELMRVVGSRARADLLPDQVLTPDDVEWREPED